jgi:acyl carrier protein
MTVSLDDVRDLVALQLGRRAVAADDRLVEDLGAESMDVMNVVAAAEDRYGVTIDEDEVPELRTAADLYERVRSRLAGGG